MSLVCEDIVPSAAVTLVVSPPIALAFAPILVLALVIEEFKEEVNQFKELLNEECKSLKHLEKKP